jgi:hypothetical protein
MALQVSIRWRMRIDEPQSEWKGDRAIWGINETIASLRRRVALSTKNDPVLAEKYDVITIIRDSDGKLLPRRRICDLDWTSEQVSEVLSHLHKPGKPTASLLFTFPQNRPFSQDEMVFDMFKQVKQSIEITREEMADSFQKIQLDMTDSFQKIQLDMTDSFQKNRLDMTDSFQKNRLDMTDSFQKIRLNIQDISKTIQDTTDVANNIVEVSVNTGRLLARSLEFGD